ncbi:MAG TPA: hypothetical protein DIT10_04735 [Chryseobacterium sp.]|nr:hypothetical protein [Chryseobacterium sp.]
MMLRNLALLSLILLPFLAKTQHMMKSPFKLKDYEKMCEDYLDAVKKEEDKIVFENHFYFIKSKKDSLIALKKEEIRNKKISEGKAPSEIKDEELLSNALFIINSYIEPAYFRIRKNGYSYFLENTDELDITTDEEINIIYWFQGDTDSEFITNKNKSLRTRNTYFHSNGQLKRTDTSKSPSGDAIGISKEYDTNGKLIFTANWDKEFRLNKEQAIKVSKKFMKESILKRLKKYNNQATDSELQLTFENILKKTETLAFKDKSPEGIAIWHIEYNLPGRHIELSFEDKSQKLIDMRSVPIIE